jgi:hypothetical protein
MVKDAVWVVAGIFALNVLLVGVVWIIVTIRRYRTERSQRRLEGIWRIPKLPSAAATRRDRARRRTNFVLSAALIWALLGLAGFRADRLVTSALGAVVPGTQSSSEPPATGVANPIGDRVVAQGGHTSSASSEGGPLASADLPTSSPDTATTTGDKGAPSTVAATSRSSTVIRLAWTHVSGANGYQIDRSIDGERWVRIGSTEQGVTTYTDAGLSSGTTYYYRVSAVTEGGSAPTSDVVSATTAIDTLTSTTVTSVSASSTEIDLSWTDVDGETGYRIERSPDGTTGWTTIATTGQDVTTYADAGLSSGTTYFYRVFATNTGGDSPPSDVSSATTATEQMPGPVQGDTPVTDPVATEPTAADPGSTIEPAP